jgi:hypothetical protein
MAEQQTPSELITLTRGECLAVAIVLSVREKSAAPAIEEALSSVEAKLRPLSDAAWNSALAALTTPKEQP